MRFRKITFTLIGVLLALLCASTACFGGGKPSIDILKKMPVSSTSFDYLAVKGLAGDEDLWMIYEKFRGSSEVTQMKDILLLANIEHFAKVSGFGQGAVTVFEGNFDVEDIQRGLAKYNYQKAPSWQEVGIWSPVDEQYKSVAVQKGIILLGKVDDLKACIDTIVMGKEKSSLYDDSNVKAVADKLPDGVVINVDKADSEEKYDALRAYGKSYSKVSAGKPIKLKLTAIYMFQDNYTAGQAQSGIKDYLGTKAFTDIKVEREDNFIRATALIYVSDFVESLVF